MTNRDAKQALGGEDPQSWKGEGPARAAALSLWLHTAIWCWYLSTHADTSTWRVRPWYRHKHTASFADALAALRRTPVAAPNYSHVRPPSAPSENHQHPARRPRRSRLKIINNAKVHC